MWRCFHKLRNFISVAICFYKLAVNFLAAVMLNDGVYRSGLIDVPRCDQKDI